MQRRSPGLPRGMVTPRWFLCLPRTTYAGPSALPFVAHAAPEARASSCRRPTKRAKTRASPGRRVRRMRARTSLRAATPRQPVPRSASTCRRRRRSRSLCQRQRRRQRRHRRQRLGRRRRARQQVWRRSCSLIAIALATVSVASLCWDVPAAAGACLAVAPAFDRPSRARGGTVSLARGQIDVWGRGSATKTVFVQ